PVAFPEVGANTEAVAVVGPGGVVVEVDVEGRPAVVVADVHTVAGNTGVPGDVAHDTVGCGHHRLQVRSEQVVPQVTARSAVPGRSERRADVSGAEDREDERIDEGRVARRLGGGRRRLGGGRRGLWSRGGG